VFLFSIAQPDVVLELDGAAFEGATHLGELAVLGGSKRDLLVTAGEEPRKLYRVGLPAEPVALFADPPELVGEATEDVKADADVDEGEGDTDGELDAAEVAMLESPAVELDPTKFEIRALTHEGVVSNPSSSPDGTRVVFAIHERSLDRPDAADDEEIGMLSLSGGGLRVLTRNALTDGQPRFTADGRHVVFLTRARIPKTRWEITAPRVVPVGE
jgi:hypothetical protein